MNLDLCVEGIVIDQFEAQVDERQPLAGRVENRLLEGCAGLVDEGDAQGAGGWPEFVCIPQRAFLAVVRGRAVGPAVDEFDHALDSWLKEARALAKAVQAMR